MIIYELISFGTDDHIATRYDIPAEHHPWLYTNINFLDDDFDDGIGEYHISVEDAELIFQKINDDNLLSLEEKTYDWFLSPHTIKV